MEGSWVISMPRWANMSCLYDCIAAILMHHPTVTERREWTALRERLECTIDDQVALTAVRDVLIECLHRERSTLLLLGKDKSYYSNLVNSKSGFTQRAMIGMFTSMMDVSDGASGQQLLMLSDLQPSVYLAMALAIESTPLTKHLPPMIAVSTASIATTVPWAISTRDPRCVYVVAGAVYYKDGHFTARMNWTADAPKSACLGVWEYDPLDNTAQLETDVDTFIWSTPLNGAVLSTVIYALVSRRDLPSVVSPPVSWEKTCLAIRAYQENCEQERAARAEYLRRNEHLILCIDG